MCASRARAAARCGRRAGRRTGSAARSSPSVACARARTPPRGSRSRRGARPARRSHIERVERREERHARVGDRRRCSRPRSSASRSALGAYQPLLVALEPDGRQHARLDELGGVARAIRPRARADHHVVRRARAGSGRSSGSATAAGASRQARRSPCAARISAGTSRSIRS